MYFDTHAHYLKSQFGDDTETILSMLPKNDIGGVMNVCIDMTNLDELAYLMDKYPFVYSSAGVHPCDLGDISEADMDILKEFVRAHGKVKAIGEIGLDYYHDDYPKDMQKEWFARQIELAKEIGLPIIVHDREAHKDTLDVLRACHAEEVGGIMHCFSGSPEFARDILDLGFYIAFGGSVTFKNATKPVESAKYVPIDRLLLETDCPYLTPTPFRGKRNCSLYLPFIADKIASVRGISVGELEDAAAANALRCFGIDKMPIGGMD